MCGTELNQRTIVLACAALTSLAIPAAQNSALAISRDFTVVTAQSSIAISGTVTNTTFGTAPITQQGPGGLTTTYSGTIKTDREPAAIEFVDGSVVTANNSGSWQPLPDASDGSSPANYGARAGFLGGFVVVNFAGRNLVAGLVGSPSAIDGSGQFDLASTSIVFASGDLAYRGPLGNPASTATLANQAGALSGSGTFVATMQNGTTTETITLPVSATFQFAADASTSINLTLTGQVVAKATFTPPPGDYNENGVVDAADYVLWREKLGSPTSLPNDDTPGVGDDDYTRWRAHFGQTISGAGGSPSGGTSVPEPSVLLLLSWAISLFAAGTGKRNSCGTELA